mmetsp:Transcript_19994/g.62872  ORF Transcript_19994/g.62872 Transcript_19994/m.62872 type:complete len:290 (+) Transcript_19994:81-950(+)
MPRVVEAASACEFLRVAERYLSVEDVANNVILGWARSEEADVRYWVCYDDAESRIEGAAMLTRGFPLMLALPTTVGASVAFAELEVDVDGVNGPAEATEAFVSSRRRRDGSTWRSEYRLVAYELSAIKPPRLRDDEELRWLVSDDAHLLERLTHDFRLDVGEDDERAERGAAIAVQRLRDGRGKHMLLQSKDGSPRCLVASTRETPSLGVISSVFTLPSFRRMGAASRTVAALAAALLDSGKTKVCLYADADEPGPNKLYHSLGFERRPATFQAFKKSPAADSVVTPPT